MAIEETVKSKRNSPDGWLRLKTELQLINDQVINCTDQSINVVKPPSYSKKHAIIASHLPFVLLLSFSPPNLVPSIILSLEMYWLLSYYSFQLSALMALFSTCFYCIYLIQSLLGRFVAGSLLVHGVLCLLKRSKQATVIAQVLVNIFTNSFSKRTDEILIKFVGNSNSGEATNILEDKKD